MNAVPLAVLNRALNALTKTHARLNNDASPDPYIDVLRSMSELGYYLGKIMENTPTQVSEMPKHISEGATA